MIRFLIDNVKLIIRACRKVNAQCSIFNSQFIIIALALIAASCRREPLYDETGSMQLNITIDYNIHHESDLPEPELMYVGLYDPNDGKLLRMEYTGPQGGEIYADPGYYDILVYNFDTEATLIRGNNNINTVEAYTNSVPPQVSQSYRAIIQKIKEKKQAPSRVNEYENQPLINEPDHLFSGCGWNTLIPVRGTDDNIFTVHASAATLLETYALTIGPITGMENIASAEVYVTGQVQSKLVATREVTGVPVVLYVPFEMAVRGRSDHLNTTFRTFGKYPDADNNVILVVKIVDYDGNITLLETDVTKQFEDPSNTGNDIVIEQPIKVEPPTGGALGPSVTLWDDEVINITI